MPASGVPRLAGCIVWTEGLAEDNSLAENVQRAPLHPWVNPRSESIGFRRVPKAYGTFGMPAAIKSASVRRTGTSRWRNCNQIADYVLERLGVLSEENEQSWRCCPCDWKNQEFSALDYLLFFTARHAGAPSPGTMEAVGPRGHRIPRRK